jgi:uncharacterized protein YlaI
MNGCTKVYFADEKNANAYIEKLNKTSDRKLKPIRAYLCEKCFNWHLTSIESYENMQLVYKERQIKNLKDKINKQEEVKNDLIKLLQTIPFVSLAQNQTLSELLYELRVKYNAPTQ